jgi:hypothetical protein
MFKKKEKWHDGYYLQDDDIVFYKAAQLSKEIKGGVVYTDDSYGGLKILFPEKLVEKVNQDEIATYESWCHVWREGFIRFGLLRLHTPIGIHQEHLGVEFLFVPVSHRDRINKMIGNGYLVMLDSVRLFGVVPAGTKIALEDLIGTGVISDQEEVMDNPINLDNPTENRFFIRQIKFKGMFTYYNSNDE